LAAITATKPTIVKEPINALGDLNLLFSDGRRLYCYHDSGGYDGLAWTRRVSGMKQLRLAPLPA